MILEIFRVLLFLRIVKLQTLSLRTLENLFPDKVYRHLEDWNLVTNLLYDFFSPIYLNFEQKFKRILTFHYLTQSLEKESQQMFKVSLQRENFNLQVYVVDLVAKKNFPLFLEMLNFNNFLTSLFATGCTKFEKNQLWFLERDTETLLNETDYVACHIIFIEVVETSTISVSAS